MATYYGIFSSASEDEKKKKPSQVAAQEVKKTNTSIYHGVFSDVGNKIVTQQTEARKKEQVIQPQQPTPTPAPAKTNIFQKAFEGVKSFAQKLVPQLRPKEQVAPTVLPENQTDDYKKELDQYLKFPSIFPNPDLSPAKEYSSATLTPEALNSPAMKSLEKKQDAIAKFWSNPVDNSINAARDFLDYHPKVTEVLADVQRGFEDFEYKDPISGKIIPVGIKKNPLHYAIAKSVSDVFLGSSQQVKDTFDMQLVKPVAPKGLEKTYATYDTVGQVVGQIWSYYAGGAVLKGLGFAKATLPVLFATLGQTSAEPDTTLTQRIQKLPVDVAAGWIFSKIPAFKPGGLSLPNIKSFLGGTSLVFNVGFGQGFLDALIKGKTKEEAIKLGAEQAVIMALFHIVASGTGLLSDEILNSKIKTGTTKFTPDEFRNVVNNSKFADTPTGKAWLKVANEAEVNGKNIEFNMQAFQKTLVAKKLNLDKPEGINIEIKLVDKAPAIGTGQVPETAKTGTITPKLDQVETLGKEIKVFRGAKDQTIDVSQANGITGGVSMSLDKSVAERFAAKVGGTVKPYLISPDAKVINHSAIEKMTEEEARKFIADNNIDVIRFDVPKGANGEAELRVVNDRVLKVQEVVPTETEAVKSTTQATTGEVYQLKQVGEYDGVKLVEPTPKEITTATNDLIKRVGKSIDATGYNPIGYFDEKGNFNLANGVNYYQPDWMKSIIPIGNVIEYHSPKGSVALQVFDQDGAIIVKRIETETKGGGLGTTIVNGLKDLADSENKILRITDTAGAEKFWDKFPFLKKGDVGVYESKLKEKTTIKKPITVASTDELLKYVDRQGFREPEQIAKLRADIKANGIKYPVELIIKEDGTWEIYDGNHRIQIAKDLGIKEIPIKVVENRQKPQIPAKKYKIKAHGELSMTTFDSLKEAQKALEYRKSIGDTGKIVEFAEKATPPSPTLVKVSKVQARKPTPLSKNKPLKAGEEVKALKVIVPKNNYSLPILTQVAVKNGKMYATDLETMVVLPTKQADGMFQIIGNDLVKSDFALVDYPEIKIPEDKVAQILPENLSIVLNKAKLAISTDETRPILTGINLRFSKTHIEVAATDGFRLFYERVGAKIQIENEKEFTIGGIPKVSNLSKSLDGIVQISENKDSVLLGNDSMNIVTRKVEGGYPDYKKIYPAYKKQITFNKKELADAVKQIAPYAKDSANITKFRSVGDNQYEISATNSESNGAVTKNVLLKVSVKKIDLPAGVAEGTLIMPVRQGEETYQVPEIYQVRSTGEYGKETYKVLDTRTNKFIGETFKINSSAWEKANGLNIELDKKNVKKPIKKYDFTLNYKFIEDYLKTNSGTDVVMRFADKDKAVHFAEEEKIILEQVEPVKPPKLSKEDRELKKWIKSGSTGSHASMDKFAVLKQISPVLYHGTSANFDAFDSSMRGTVTGAKSAEGAIWFTDDPRVAKAYAIYAAEDGVINQLQKQIDAAERTAQISNKQSDWKKYDALVVKQEELGASEETFARRKLAVVKEAKVKGDFYEVDAQGKTPQDLSADGGIDSWLNMQLDKARDLGKDGVIFKNLDDAVGLHNVPSTHYAVFDTKNIIIKTKEKVGSSSGYASVDKFADFKRIAENSDYFKAVEFPELLRMFKDITGEFPSVKLPRYRPTMGGRPYGLFIPKENGKIVLNPEIFATPEQAVKTFAHEIGHLTDYMPEGMMKRGNLLGRLLTLNKNLKQSFGDLKNVDVKEELKALTQLWKPFDESRVPESFVKYRYSPAELYADAISVLFNDPQLLQTKAPIFWQKFFEFLDRKPLADENFRATWDLLNKGDEAIFNERNKAMDEGFKNAEDKFYMKELEKRKQSTNFLYQLQILFDNKNQSIINKVKEARAKGVAIEDSKNPMYEMQGLNYLDGVLKNYVADTFQPIFEKAQSIENGWETLGKVLQLERVIYERGELANPGGYNPETAQKQLDQLKAHTDPKDWIVIDEARAKFREVVQRSVDDIEKAEFYTPELITEMKANPAYATFQVVDYLDTYVSARTYKSVGTLKEVANPATSTVMKLISIKKAIERNKVKVDMKDLLVSGFGKEIEKARTVFSGKRREFLEPKDPDKGLLITIEGGKPQGYYIDKEIARSFNYLSNDVFDMAVRATRLISQSKFYRPLFTTINLGFQTFNFMRDFMRYWKNIPDFTFKDSLLSFPRAVVRYAQATPHAYRRVRNIPDAMVTAMENSKMLGMTFNDVFRDPVDIEDKQIERILEKVGILEKTNKRKIMKPIYWTLDAITGFGSFIESLPKLAGYIELKDKMPENQLALFIRTEIGSPDFRVSGYATPITNNLFLFSNAIKEGIKSDFQLATGKSAGGKYSQSGFWWKNVVSTILPKMLMVAAGLGLFGKWMKDRMDDASEYDKANYTVVPLGIDENGKSVYLRVPQDESGRMIGALTWKITNMFMGKGLKVSDIQDLIAFGAGQFPNLTPSITGIGATIDYLSGKNPYDTFRGRNIIPDTEFQAGWKYSLPIFTKWLAQNQGLGIFVPNYVEDDPTKLQKVLGLPILSNILGRWIKVSDYGRTEQNREVINAAKTEQAGVNLERRKLLDKYVKEYQQNKGIVNKLQLQRELVTEVLGHAAPRNAKEKTLKTNTEKKFQIAILKGESDANMNSLIDAPSNDAKADLLKSLKSTLTDDEFKDLTKTALKYKVISNAVLIQSRK